MNCGRKKSQTVVKATSRVEKFSKSDIIVSPSILSANFAKLGDQVSYSNFFSEKPTCCRFAVLMPAIELVPFFFF